MCDNNRKPNLQDICRKCNNEKEKDLSKEQQPKKAEAKKLDELDCDKSGSDTAAASPPASSSRCGKRKRRRARSSRRSSRSRSAKRRKKDGGADAKFEIGENFLTPRRKGAREGLRPIFIDGSNVAFSHGNNKYFSVKGLKMCIDFFKKRGHEVKAFVPQFRLRKDQTDNPMLLKKLVDKKYVVVTPSLTIRNRIRSPYDDWYIVQAAAIEGGVIVSRDGFRDILKRRPSLRPVIEERRLVPTWVKDTLLFPMDPLGTRGCDLETFLHF